MRELGGHRGRDRPRLLLRRALLRHQHRRPAARRAAAARAGAGDARSQTQLVFWDLEWAALDDERAEELLAHDELDFSRHHLESARRYRPHLLSEPEEKLMSEKAVTGRSAWDRLFEEQTSAIRGHAARTRTSRSRSRSRSRASPPPTATSAARRPRRSPRRCARACAPAPTSSTRCWPTRRSTTGCATTRPGCQCAQPRQRGVRRVRRGAGQRGAQPLRDRRAAGTA